MGAKKGKKAWRKQIDTTVVEEAVATQQREDQQGTGVTELKDEQLFFVDKEPKNVPFAAVAKHKKRDTGKPLRCHVVTQAPQSVKPAVDRVATKPKSKLVLPHERQQQLTPAISTLSVRRKRKAADAPTYDLWAPEGKEAAGTGKASHLPTGGAPQTVKRRKPVQPALIRAVEVDAEGSSYNPDPVHHQQVVAEAVASEVAKALKAELNAGTKRSMLQLQHRAVAQDQDELDQLQVDADTDSEDEELNAVDPAGVEASLPSRPTDRLTRKDRNSKLRRVAASAEEDARRQLKQQRRDLDNLRELAAELEIEQAHKEAVRIRKAVVKAEKAMQQPPRLGRVKFTPEPVQVLLTEELSGSLRKLKASALLLRDRYKSLQKRGIIEPRTRAKKTTRHRIAYKAGERAEKAEAGMEEIRAAERARKTK